MMIMPNNPGSSNEDNSEQNASLADPARNTNFQETTLAKRDCDEGAHDKRNMALEWAKAIGMPVVTLFISLIGGYYLTNLSKDREVVERSEQLYAQLLTQREQSDTLVRKDMFNVVISSILADAKQEDLGNKVLQLELLANNFSQSLDIAPLFKDLSRRLIPNVGPTSTHSKELKNRLDRTARNLVFKQVNSLAQRGFVKDKQISLAGWDSNFGKPFIDTTILLSKLIPSIIDVAHEEIGSIRCTVEIVDVNIERQEVEIRLRVDFSDTKINDVDRHFWVGQYDFPMLDNTLLPYGLRTSVVITEFLVPDAGNEQGENSFVQFHLVVFSGTKASFKDRQDYDDVLFDMLNAGGRAKNRERSSQ